MGAPFDLGRSSARAAVSGRGRSGRPRRCSPSALAGPTTTRTTHLPARTCASWTSAMPTSSTPTREKPRQHQDRRAGHPRSRRASGGDRRRPLGQHSLHRRLRGEGPIHIFQIDAHLDFVDERHGVRLGHGSPMRRAAEKSYVTGLTQVGIRNVSSTTRDGYEAARPWGRTSVGPPDAGAGPDRRRRTDPGRRRVYVTLDIDGFCPSIAPGTGTPPWRLPLLRGPRDASGARAPARGRGDRPGGGRARLRPHRATAILAAQILLNFLGFVFHARAERATAPEAVATAG